MNDGIADTILPVADDREVVGSMKTPEEVQTMLALHQQGHTPHRIAQLMHCSRNTVTRYLAQGEWRSRQRPPRSLDGLDAWLTERFLQHDGNADVVRQQLLKEHDIDVSLRTVERAVQPLRQRLTAARQATVRYETKPGDQMQIDFGTKRIEIGHARQAVHVFVATLGYSRRQYLAAREDESQRSWFDGMEGAFRHFDGVPQTVLIDNAKALVSEPRREGRAPTFHPRLQAFARYWGFEPRACLPYRARTKGKDERSVGYIKRNALAGHTFASWGELDRHLVTWLDEVADVRIHGVTGATPLERFVDERACLTPLADRPSFGSPTELTRTVSRDCAIALDTNQYTVPWELVGQRVSVSVAETAVRVYHGAKLVACHARCRSRHQRIVDPVHVKGLRQPDRPVTVTPTDDTLVRPLDDYQRVIEETTL